MMKYIERAYPWLLLAPAALPVVVWSGVIYPYLVPKTLLFYALSLLSLAAFALLAASGRAFYWGRLRAWWPVWTPAALLALAYLASALGLDFYRSFWSLFVRGDGLLMLTLAVADFYLITLYANRVFFERLIRVVALVGAFVAAYGVGEWVVSGGRIGSLLGNAAFFAGYLTLAFFATFLTLGGLSRVWRFGAYAALGTEAAAIVLSATRGSILALSAAFLAFLSWMAWRGAGKRRGYAALALSALVVSTGLFTAFRGALAHAPFTPVARLASISAHDPDVASRLFLWRNMLAEIAKRPLLGVGAEHIDALFNSFYDPTQIQEEWFDRSHNAFLDYAAEYGIGGLLLYLALIGSFFLAARRLARLGEPALAGALALFALAYAAQNFFVFDTISSFWLFLALLALALSRALPSVPSTRLPLPPYARGVAWPLAAALTLLIIPVSAYPALAAYDLAHAYLFPLVDVAKENSYLSRGMGLGTYGDVEYGYEVYDLYVNQQHARLSGGALEAAYRETESILALNFARYPYDARTALYLAHVLSLAPEGVAADRELLSAALARAVKESPKRSQPWYVLVNLSIERANAFPPKSAARIAGYAAAENLLSRYIALVPTLSEPHFVLAELARAMGDPERAAAAALLGKRYYRTDLETARRAAGFYESVSDWRNARFFLAEVVALAPLDDTSRYDLAKVSYLAGDPAAAERIVAELRTRAPGIIGTDPNFLAAITAYEQSKR